MPAWQHKGGGGLPDSEIQSTGSLRGGAPHNQQVGKGLVGGGLRSPPPPQEDSINQSGILLYLICFAKRGGGGVPDP